MKASIIVADPPWAPKDSLTMSKVKRGAKANYNTLTTDDLCNLPINQLANSDGCVLALWVLGSMLEDGLKVMKDWGFQQKQVFVWVKTKKQPLKNKCNETFDLGQTLGFGLGRAFRNTHEICLIGMSGKNVYKKLLKNKSQRTVCFAENLKHSSKPEELQNRLDIMFSDKDLVKVELFARRDRQSWICVGNECPSTKGQDIKDSLINLINL